MIGFTLVFLVHATQQTWERLQRKKLFTNRMVKNESGT